MKVYLTLAAVILALVAAVGVTTRLYMQAKIERDLAKSETEMVDKGLNAAIDYWKGTAEENERQIGILNDGYAKARAEQSVAEKYLAEHKLAKAIERKPDLVAPVYNRMVAGMFQDISDATTRPAKPPATSKTSEAGRAKAPAP